MVYRSCGLRDAWFYINSYSLQVTDVPTTVKYLGFWFLILRWVSTSTVECCLVDVQFVFGGKKYRCRRVRAYWHNLQYKHTILRGKNSLCLWRHCCSGLCIKIIHGIIEEEQSIDVHTNTSNSTSSHHASDINSNTCNPSPSWQSTLVNIGWLYILR